MDCCKKCGVELKAGDNWIASGKKHGFKWCKKDECGGEYYTKNKKPLPIKKDKIKIKEKVKPLNIKKDDKKVKPLPDKKIKEK